MKIGSETASTANWLMSNNNTYPEVGKDCTLLMWTDRLSYKVLDQVGEDKFIIAEYADCYDEETPLGTILRHPRHIRKGRNGKWQIEKVDRNNMGVATGKYEKAAFVFGVRDGFRDPCF